MPVLFLDLADGASLAVGPVDGPTEPEAEDQDQPEQHADTHGESESQSGQSHVGASLCAEGTLGGGAQRDPPASALERRTARLLNRPFPSVLEFDVGIR